MYFIDLPIIRFLLFIQDIFHSMKEQSSFHSKVENKKKQKWINKERVHLGSIVYMK